MFTSAEVRLCTDCTTRATCVRYVHLDVVESVSAEACDRSTQDLLTEFARDVLAADVGVRGRLRDELCILRVRAADCFATITIYFEPSPLVLREAEQRVVSLVGFGHGDAGIARLLRIGIGTVKQRLHTAMQRTRLPTRSAVLKRSLQLDPIARSESGECPDSNGG